MLVAGLALVLDATLARVSAIKNLLSAVIGLTTVVVFAIAGPVNWAGVAVVAPATLVGGYAGARLVRRLPSVILKTVIVVFGTVIGTYLLWRACPEPAILHFPTPRIGHQLPFGDQRCKIGEARATGRRVRGKRGGRFR